MRGRRGGATIDARRAIISIELITRWLLRLLGINSGSQPLTSGRAGFGFSAADVTRRGFVDHLELYRQL
mgnify:CR=1 FL=1